MYSSISLSPLLGQFHPASAILSSWRHKGAFAARQALADYLIVAQNPSDLLIQELQFRLNGCHGPRILVDGLWFSRPYGGITRVWEQILRCWSLPGLISDQAPIALIDRENHLALAASLHSIEGKTVNPLETDDISSLAQENTHFVRQWRANVFISSWISSSGLTYPACPELALVHDCLPERYGVPAALAALRRRWLLGSAAQLAVSQATAADLAVLLSRSKSSIPWCHPCPSPIFSQISSHSEVQRLTSQLIRRSGLRPPYVLLPATSSVGSYKNPEVVARAFCDPALRDVQLVLSGISAEQRCQELEDRFPHLKGRCLAAGFTDLELAIAYRAALAVVVPSLAEGFGLPAAEALAVGANLIIADSRGLSEAAGVAALRFHPRNPRQLAELIKLFLSDNIDWLLRRLAAKRHHQLSTFHPDLLGLSLLALARSISS